MDERSRSITEALVETSSSLAESISARVDEVNNTLKATGDSLVLDLSLRGGDVVTKLEQTGAAITDAITGGGCARVGDLPASRRGPHRCRSPSTATSCAT